MNPSGTISSSLLLAHYLNGARIPFDLTLREKLKHFILDQCIEASCRRYRRDEDIFPHPRIVGPRTK